MAKTAGTSFVFCCCLAAAIVVSEMTASANAFLEPFASQFIMKKMMLKHGLGAPVMAAPRPAPVVYYSGVHYPPQPAPPSPQPPRPTYPAYGPQPTSYPAYGPPPPSYSGYEPASPSVVAKPQPQPPQSGCVHTSPQVDYSNYAAHGGHGYGSYGNGGGYGK